MRRRQVLSTVGVAAFAGCVGLGSDQPSTYGLGSIVALNKHSKPHRLTVRVTADGEEVFRSSTELAAMRDGQPGWHTFETGLADTRRTYRADVRVDGDDWRPARLPSLVSDENCVELVCDVGRDETPGIFWGPCSGSSTASGTE